MKYAILAAVIIVLCFPILWMANGSLMQVVGIMRMPPKILYNASFDNYVSLLQNVPFLLWLTNTIILLAMAVGLSITVTVMASYSFSVYRFTGRAAIWWAFLITLMLPRQSLLIPLYVICRILGISGLRMGAAFPLIFAAFPILLAKNFIDRIPRELVDSARIDGCGEIGIIMKIMMPLCRPIIAALALFKTVECLSDYLWQSLILQADSKRTLLVGLFYAVSQRGGGQDWVNLNPLGLKMTAGVILFIPLLVIFICASKHFVGSLTLGGMKE